jgi:hypothetical protein
MVRVMLPRIADDRPMMPFDAVEPVTIDANPVMVPIKAVPLQYGTTMSITGPHQKPGQTGGPKTKPGGGK